MNSKTQTEIIRENEMIIIQATKSGLAKGLSLRYILCELADGLNIQYSTLNNFWYRNKWNDKLPEECRKMIKAGASKKQKEPESSNETVIQPIESNENKKETVGKKIYTLVKQTNANMSHLEELYNIQGEDLKLQMKRGFKKLEDSQQSFILSVNNKLSKALQLDQPVEVLNAPTKFAVDYKSDVKVLQAPLEFKYDEDKVNGLISEIEGLEETKSNLLNDLEIEMDLRKKSEDAYDMLEVEANFMKEEMDKLNNELQNEKEYNKNLAVCKLELEKQVKLALDEIKQLEHKNKQLSNRGLMSRLFNRNVEYDTVTN